GAPVGQTRPRMSVLAGDGDVAGLRALRALLGLVLDLRAFFQALVALPLDRAEVHEDVVAAVGLCDEAVALVGVEPLDGSGCHVHTSPTAHERAAEGAGPTRYSLSSAVRRRTVAALRRESWLSVAWSASPGPRPPAPRPPSTLPW